MPGPDYYDQPTRTSTIENSTQKIFHNATPSKGAAPAFMDNTQRNFGQYSDRRYKENQIAAPGQYF